MGSNRAASHALTMEHFPVNLIIHIHFFTFSVLFHPAQRWLVSTINSSMAEPRGHFAASLVILCLCSHFLRFSVALRLSELGDEFSWLNEDDDVAVVQTRRESHKSCDLSTGKWVLDQSYPLYDSNCPYLSTAVTCQRNGRPDSDYEKWRWKPQSCSIPRYIFAPYCPSLIFWVVPIPVTASTNSHVFMVQVWCFEVPWEDEEQKNNAGGWFHNEEPVGVSRLLGPRSHSDWSKNCDLQWSFNGFPCSGTN